VVEPGPEVVEDVSDQHSPFQSRWPLPDLHPDQALSCVRVRIGERSVRVGFEEPLNGLVEHFQVLVRTVEFGLDAL